MQLQEPSLAGSEDQLQIGACRDRTMAERRDWVVQFQERHQSVHLSNENLWNKQCIYRVPSFMRSRNNVAYDPHFVSLGPYHHGEARLMPMEEHKVRAVLHFLENSDKPMTDYVNALVEVVEELMGSYDQLECKWRDRDKFLELMFHDGCFLLEIMRKFVEESLDSSNKDYRDYADNDPIFGPHGFDKFSDVIFEDTLKIENQVPLLVLNKLVAVERGMTQGQSIVYINDLVVKFFRQVNSFVIEIDDSTDLGSNTFIHMLALARKCMVGDLDSDEQGEKLRVLSATVLNRDAKVEFNAREKNSLIGFAFDEEKGILNLPSINIYDCTESVLLNLIAFEHLHTGISQHVSSYVYYIDGLIQSIEDLNLLWRTISTDKSDDEIVRLIPKLRHDMGFIPRFTLFHVSNPLNEYYEKRTSKWEKRFRKWRSNFMEKYFDSPWSLIALLAAALLLVLTVLQTVYAILSYYKPADDTLQTYYL
ncbi:UPF0481 protein At3g47200-like isoform X2 [Tasmannia lanceolata]|uniref:UPF0481 protein At3g47200-like isoform X2 n=1 Tax=Tasmannia lanceolata TaxID=3420 RepID=UPI0040636664